MFEADTVTHPKLPPRCHDTDVFISGKGGKIIRKSKRIMPSMRVGDLAHDMPAGHSALIDSKIGVVQVQWPMSVTVQEADQVLF